MASEADASCESDPNFAIICAFMEKFGGLCGLQSIDFVELQQMLENNQEVPAELINLHIKLLRKTKKNVTLERWERALINMCHTFSSKDAWEIERFGYKKTRLQIKLRALKELLEMQFDYNTKFKNEINKMTADNLRAQPLGRDKLGCAYWFQSDNNYQIRIYKEDPDEETWVLIAKDRKGLLALITELNDGDSKLSSDSACNEDSNSLLDKPFLDTGQNENFNENKEKDAKPVNTDAKIENADEEIEKTDGKSAMIDEKMTKTDEKKLKTNETTEKKDEKMEEIDKKSKLEATDDFKESAKEPELELEKISDSEGTTVINRVQPEQIIAEEKNQEVPMEKTADSPEVKRPMLRIKSLSELMEKPKGQPKTNFMADFPELTIIKKPKLDLPEITIVKKSRTQQPHGSKGVQVKSPVKSPVLIIRGNGTGSDNKCGNPIVGNSIEEPVMHISDRGSGQDCQMGNQQYSYDNSDIIIGEEVEEPVMYISGVGCGVDCYMENDKELSDTKQGDKSNINFAEIDQTANQVPTSQLNSVKLGTIIDSKTDNKTFPTRDPSKRSRWDQKETPVEVTDDSKPSEPSEKNMCDQNESPLESKDENTTSPKKMTFFFGPGSLNVTPLSNTTVNDSERENPDGNSKTEHSDSVSPKENKTNEASKGDATIAEILEENESENKKDELKQEVSQVEDSIEGKSNTEIVKLEISECKEDEVNDQSTECGSNEEVQNKIHEGETQKQLQSENINEKENTEDAEKEGLNLCNPLDDDTNKISESNADKLEDSTDEESAEHIEKSTKTEDKTESTIILETAEVETHNIQENKEVEPEPLASGKEKDGEVNDEETVDVPSLSEKESTELQDDRDNDKNESSVDVEAAETSNVDENSVAESNADTDKIESTDEVPNIEVKNIKENSPAKETAANSTKAENKESENSDCEKDELDCAPIKIEESKEGPKKSALEHQDNDEQKKITEKDNQVKLVEENGDNINEKEQVIDVKLDVKLEKQEEKKASEKLTKDEVKVNEVGEDESNIDAPTKRKRLPRNSSKSTDSGNKLLEEKVSPNKKVPQVTPVKMTRRRGQSMVNAENDGAVVETLQEICVNKESVVAEATPSRSTRQTRSSKLEPPPSVKVTKTKSKAKKVTSRASKPLDTPKPLESVTIVDADNQTATADHTETDPLAVSDGEEENVENQNVPSLTSFSLDYNPSSPAPTNARRNLRKRGRESIENKPEVGETSGKKPKMKGKRTIDINLRKSVEEKRQQKVGDASSDDNESQNQDTPENKAKEAKKTLKKKVLETSISDGDNLDKKTEKKALKTPRTSRLLKSLGVKEEDITAIAESPVPVRQSRRLAQIKIKEEAIRRKTDDEDHPTKKKKKKLDDKDFKVGKRKRIEEEVKPAPMTPIVEKKKQRKKTKHKKISIGWNTSSDDSDVSCQEEEDVSEYEEPHEEEPLQFKSDHEFSPESDLENDEPLPLKRARTARKEESDNEEAEEEFSCQKCGKSDHPEWILLCDKCDNGWHCSCLRPALFVIPEGDWYCPSCQHEMLLDKLHEKLVEFDKMLLKKEMEDRRKERLAYVGISLNNVLPAKEKKDKAKSVSPSEESSVGDSDSGESSDSDEPIYQLRQRRQAHSYKFQDFDDLINSALQEEPPVPVQKTHTLGRGKDIATIVNAAKEEEERNAEKNGFDDLPPVVPRNPEESKKKAMSYRKKPRRLNNLEVNSDDEADDSDEDFKGSSSEASEEDDYEEGSDDSLIGRRGSRAVRRSTRARTTRFDADFINDEDSDDVPTKKKKKRRSFISESESELSDDWRGSRKKTKKRITHKKMKKKKKYFDDSDLETYRKKKPKIKYGRDSDSENKGRKTRGKRTSYLDTLGSDSEEEALKVKHKANSEDDEYVAEEDDKESEEDEEAEIDRGSDEDEEAKTNDRKKDTISDVDKNHSESDDETPFSPKKLRVKNRRAIIDSDEEEDEPDEKVEPIIQKTEESALPKQIEEPKTLQVVEELKSLQHVAESKSSQHIEETPKPKDDVNTLSEVPRPPKLIEVKDFAKLPRAEPPLMVPMLNVERLKACGITLTKVVKDKCDIPLNIDKTESPRKILEIGTKAPFSSLNQKINQTLAPISIEKFEKSIDEIDEEEMEKMMENEDYANRQLQLAALQIQARRMKQHIGEVKDLSKHHVTPMISRKPGDNTLKKVRTGRFFNSKPAPEPMLGNASSLMLHDDDNDELSEPPGVALPLFSGISVNSTHSLQKPNGGGELPRNNTPPPLMAPNRATPVALHNMGSSGQPYPISMGPMHSSRPLNSPIRNVRPSGPVNPISSNSSIGGNIPMGSNVHMNIHPPAGINFSRRPSAPINLNTSSVTISHPVSTSSGAAMGSNNLMAYSTPRPISVMSSNGQFNNIPLGSSAQGINVSVGSNAPGVSSGVPVGPNTPMGASLPGGPKSKSSTPPESSPEGTPKKRKGRGKGKKTLAAEAAAAAAAAGLPVPEPPSTKTTPNKPIVANIEIASPPQPFSQSQPAASVITRMLQCSPGKSSFPVGRIRPKQFAMMADTDNDEVPTRPIEGHGEAGHKDGPPPAPHPSAHYGAPPAGQFPQNYYQKDGQAPSPHGFHHQRQPQHSYTAHPNQQPIDQPSMNAPPPPATQPPPLNQRPPSTPPPTQLSGSPLPPKPTYDPIPNRPTYPNPNPGYNYDYNAAPPPVANSDEGLPAPTYENPSAYPEQYDNPGANNEADAKGIEDEPSGEFGGLVSYFSSQHEDDLDT